MISRLLIANRGEIAVRIARTAHHLGISTVGVYSDPDRRALHTATVDTAVALGGMSPAESYLRERAIIQAALDTGADAIHPGYGFLAENADFAEAVIESGITWVGPHPDQIRLLGDKVAAKRVALDAGVPTAPLIEVSRGVVPDAVPLPALVKAAAGGGGRGMRVVHEQADLAEAIAAASREAESAFGDGTVFIEPFIVSGRHIEVQVLGDIHGNVVHLGDRECSIQRRNQKVIEEAPAPAIGEATRRRLHEGALALARAVGYVGAGTVEFMVEDTADLAGCDDPTITFLEVNTRLQVEHPVTEAITGVDLVAAQLSIATGAPLDVRQGDIGFEGHAIELRLVSEDPASGWLPSTGTLSEFEIDDLDGRVRIDAGYRAGDIVSTEYDSLLAKVVAHASDRVTAARRLGRVMRTARIVGVRTNVEMLGATMADADFRAGRTRTSYLDEHPGVVHATGPRDDDRLALVLAATFADERNRRSADSVTGFAPSGWRNLATRGQRRTWIDGQVEHHVEYRIEGDVADVRIGPWPEPDPGDGALPVDTRRRVRLRILDRAPGRETIEMDGRRHAVDVRDTSDGVVVSSPAGTAVFARRARFADHDAAASGSGPVSPLPGTVIAVHVAPGDVVREGQLMMVVEAMKMEHPVLAGSDGAVADVRFEGGDRVSAGDLLVVVDHDDCVGP